MARAEGFLGSEEVETEEQPGEEGRRGVRKRRAGRRGTGLGLSTRKWGD